MKHLVTPLSRRCILKTAAKTSGLAALGSMLPAAIPAWAQSPAMNPAMNMDSGAIPANLKGLGALTGNIFELAVEAVPVRIDGKDSHAITVNGQLPGPLLRWREGEEVELRVTNHLEEDTSIHWHGILTPFLMDGVPGLTFPGIKPGETFTYRFRVPQNGTYWYHSHSGLQEQSGHYGPLLIEPADRDPVAFDREYIVMLSDWTFLHPHRLFSLLKKNSEALNFQKRTVGTFFRDIGQDGFAATLKNRLMWGEMRMSPADIADVTGATYTYVVNGHGPQDNWTALFDPGERIRLRFINSSAMTIFDVRIPGLPMTIVQADGQNVEPVETDEFQIGVAETYDVIVQPTAEQAYTLFAESIERRGYARATLAPRAGMTAPVPELRPRPTLTMRDMGMDMSGMGGSGMDMSSAAAPAMNMASGDGAVEDHSMHMPATTTEAAVPPEAPAMNMPMPATDAPEAAGMAGMDHSAMDHAAMNHASMDHGGMEGMDGMQMQAHPHPDGVGNQMTAMSPTNRQDEPGLGLDNQPHRVLTYSQLRSLEPNPDQRPPGREMQIHLTGNMHRYMWSFDGRKFSDIVEPIVFREGERLRVTLVNDTMMSHPIHLHGMFFELVNRPNVEADANKPRKHTVIVKPGERLSFDVTADNPGDWAFHCHLLYHMHAGMFQVVSVRPQTGVNA